MKNLLTNSISATVGFPVKSGTLDFLQTASSEMLNALARSIIGKDFSTGTPYALYGCNNTGSGSYYVIQEGAILWNGILYLVPAVSFTLTGGNSVFVGTSISYVTTNADPVTFTDGVARYVHADTKMSVYQNALAPSPSAGFAYSSLAFFWELPYTSVSSYGVDVVSGTAKYNINRDGLVSLSGNVILDASTPSTTTLFTLSVAPINDLWLPIFAKSSSITVIASLKIDTAGVVTLQAISGTVSNFNSFTVYLNGVSFYNN